MKKLMASLKITPRDTIARISVTHDHFKLIREAKGDTIYTRPCPSHGDETPTLPVALWQKNSEKGPVAYMMGVRACLMCWHPAKPLRPEDKPVNRSITQLLYRREYHTVELQLGDHTRQLHWPRSKAMRSQQSYYVRPCADHTGATTVVVSLLMSDPYSTVENGWPWVSKEEAKVCLICWKVLKKWRTGKVELPPWAEKKEP